MTPPPASARRKIPPFRAADVSWLAGAAFLTLLTLIHLLRRDVSPSWQTTSEYAIGGLGWLMTVAFLLSAVAAREAQVSALVDRWVRA